MESQSFYSHEPMFRNSWHIIGQKRSWLEVKMSQAAREKLGIGWVKCSNEPSSSPSFIYKARLDSTDNKPSCNCPEGWTCTITKTEPSKVGKPYAKCGASGCSCVTETTMHLQTVDTSAESKVICECPEGWSCVVSKTDGPEAGKTYFECGEGCICMIDETNTVKAVYA
ncbi:hypothetical protein CTI12_AA529570 [Artemisia annua]|uniref:Uncharacterized protein n=1 Tax=Artemisia annua TaxID=35608 RepID=A0A2U1L540_ARTAN|nr:hypothetical protein CTI12_AA529570 [Artemisia annua]